MARIILDPMKASLHLIATLLAIALLTGCGVLGCAGAGGNSGYSAGCGTNVRF